MAAYNVVKAFNDPNIFIDVMLEKESDPEVVEKLEKLKCPYDPFPFLVQTDTVVVTPSCWSSIKNTIKKFVYNHDVSDKEQWSRNMQPVHENVKTVYEYKTYYHL